MTYPWLAELHKIYEDRASGKTYRVFNAESAADGCDLCCFGGRRPEGAPATFPEYGGHDCTAPLTLPICGTLKYFKEEEGS